MSMYLTGKLTSRLGLTNRLNSISGKTPDYDAAGEMTSDDHSGGTFSHQYTWDAEGRQLAATTQGAGTANYTYDGDGNRLKKVSGGVTTLYWYDAGGNILSESDGAGTLQKDYMYFNGRRIAMLYSSSAKFYFGDQIGSARQLTSSIGTAWDERVDSLLIVK